MDDASDANRIDGRMERARRLRDERRAEVLAAARRVFAAKGYHAASIASIVAAARTARGTFYLYFRNKRAIFDELLDEMLRQIQGSVRRIDVSPGAPPAVDQMREDVERVLAVLIENRDLTRLVLHEAVGLDPDFDAKLEAFYGSIIGRIRGALELGQRVGLVRDCDTGLTAHCILGSLKEAVYRLVVLADPARLDRAAFVRAVMDYNLRGVFL